MASCSDPVFSLDFDGIALQCEEGRAVTYAELKELSDRQHAERTNLRQQIEEIRARHRKRNKK